MTYAILSNVKRLRLEHAQRLCLVVILVQVSGGKKPAYPASMRSVVKIIQHSMAKLVKIIATFVSLRH